MRRDLLERDGWTEPVPGRFKKGPYIIQQFAQWDRRENYCRLIKDGVALDGRFEFPQDAAEAVEKLERKGVAA
jgi:hypothetical protein